MADKTARYLDPEVLNKIGGFDLRPRRSVEGFMTGLHESPYKGSSVEFAEHREYVPGDDIRHVDWKIYGRSDRFYIKEFEEETNLKTYVVLDVSKSMAYAGEGRPSKLEIAKKAAASLLYLVQRQRDAGALVTFGSGVEDFLPPATSGAHFRNMLDTLGSAGPKGETQLGAIFDEIAERLTSRSLVILLSDLFDSDEEAMLRGLQRMAFRGHDAIVFHVLDGDEIDFPFARMTRFDGLEIDDKILADPKALRDAYREELEGLQTRVRTACLGGQFDFEVLDTSRPLAVSLSTYLAQRAGRR